MDHKSVAVTETVEASAEFRSLSISRGTSDLVPIDPLASRCLQRLLLALAVLLAGTGPPVTPDRHDYLVEYVSKL